MEFSKFDIYKFQNFVEELLNSTSSNFMNFDICSKNRIWDSPLFGYADGYDEKFSDIKESIGEFYLLPIDIMSMVYPNMQFKYLSIMSIAFSHAKRTIIDQEKSAIVPSARWRYSRRNWEKFMKDITNSIKEYMCNNGVKTVIPELLNCYNIIDTSRKGLTSNWSHRHTAYVAGLGTFGLSNGLITKNGKSVRFMSIITDAEMPIKERFYDSIYDWCLLYQGKKCGECIGRCPAGAITIDGHDKWKCYDYNRQIDNKFLKEGDGVNGCGLCQSKVPCATKVP